MTDEQKNDDLQNEEQNDAPQTESNDYHLEAKCAEYELGWKRALADYENLKRDIADHKMAAREGIKVDFAESLLPVMDNFSSAVTHAPEVDDPKVQNWLQGVLYIQKQFAEVMENMGLEQIPTVGETFDPHLHDAAEERQVEGKGDQEVLEELTQGWKMGDRVIRPARVIINKIETE